jgi:tetratricopeptide (TPR) repeat protein
MGHEVSFGRHRFDPLTGRLWAGRREVNLTPRAAAVLDVLVVYGPRSKITAEALEHFRAVVALAPEDANARFYLGLTQIRIGEFGAAIPPLEQALHLDPSLQYSHYHLGLSYFQEQRYPEALTQSAEIRV